MKRFILIMMVLAFVLTMSGCFLLNREPVVESIKIEGEGNNVTLTLKLFDPDNDPLSVTVDWGDGIVVSEDDITTETVEFSHEYSEENTYDVVIKVSDGKTEITLPTLTLTIPF